VTTHRRVTFTLLSKPGCHLCEELRNLLDELQPDFGYAIEEVDITSRADLLARYRYEIPVLLQAGAVVASGRIDERRLRAILAGSAAAG
jgi:glutaredoxin